MTGVRFAAGMLALIVLVHFGYHLDDLSMQSRVFYVARGVFGAALLLIVAYGRSPIEIAVCAYGACEEGLTAACGSWYLWHPHAPHNGWSGYGACHAATGISFTALALCVIAVLLTWIVNLLKKEQQ